MVWLLPSGEALRPPPGADLDSVHPFLSKTVYPRWKGPGTQMDTPPVNSMGEKDSCQPQQQGEKNLELPTQIRQHRGESPTEILELRVSPDPASQILENPQETEKLPAELERDSAKSHGSASAMSEPLQASDFWVETPGSWRTPRRRPWPEKNVQGAQNYFERGIRKELPDAMHGLFGCC